jgi:UDP-N-acetylmuramyl pentapeptide phosphotransferase/UDP-N-acetylglucosamine-1-phosphate transferase
MLAWAAFAGFVVAFACTRALLPRLGAFALDRPNERSLHQRPVPRIGGIGVLAGAATSLAFGAAQLWLPMSIALILAAVSIFDDVRGMPTLVRLLLHLAAAGVLLWYLLSPMHPAQLVLLVLGVAWMTNLYNFMDGSDGLAGGMALIGFAAYALAAYSAGHTTLAALCAALAGAAGAFLVDNFHPARLFLGDVGSIPLGFLAGGLGIVGWRDGVWPLWFPILVFAPFVADATVTLLKRLIRRERVWQAHRDHYYQRMVRMGLGHRGTAFAGYGLMLLCAAAALLGRQQPPVLQAAAFGLASALLAAMAIWVDVRWTRSLQQSGNSA